MTPWWTAASATACRAWTASLMASGIHPGHASLFQSPDERADVHHHDAHHHGEHHQDEHDHGHPDHGHPDHATATRRSHP